MKTLYDDLAELVSLTQQYVIQQHDRKDWVSSDLETYNYYKQGAAERRQSATIAQEKPVSISTPPPKAFVSQIPAANTQPRQEIQPKVSVVQEQPQKTDKPTFKFPNKPNTPPAKSAPKAYATHDFKREPVDKKNLDQLDDVKKDVKQLFPKLTVQEDIPCDKQAIHYSRQWELKQSVAFLVCQETPQHAAFLGKISEAIISRFCPVEFIETSQTPFDEKHILVLVSANSQKNPHFKANASNTIFLTDVEEYLSNPELKKTLWKSICEKLQK
jgi:hypothetical protein